MMLKSGSLIRFKQCFWMTLFNDDGTDADVFINDYPTAIVLDCTKTKYYDKLFLFFDGYVGIYRDTHNKDAYYSVIYEE